MKHGRCVRGIVFAVLFWTVSQRPFVMRKDKNGARKQKQSLPNVALNRRVFVSQKNRPYTPRHELCSKNRYLPCGEVEQMMSAN